MWIIKQDGSANNTDYIIGITKIKNKILAIVAAGVGNIRIAEYETEEAAEREYLDIISALAHGETIYYVNGGPWT